jgi:uncharacterized protein
MIIVSNTSPLSSLAKIDKLILLKQIYDTIIIPQAVYQELMDIRAGKKINETIKNARWIKTQSVTNLQLVNHLESKLDQGEAAAITLALELNADQLLMDEKLGRIEATRLKLTLTGVLGILLIAKKRGLISNVQSVIDELISQTVFRVGNQLYYRILREANED